MLNLGLLTPQITQLMFTYPKSAVRVWRMLMHLTSGHMTLIPGEFHLVPEFPSPNRP